MGYYSHVSDLDLSAQAQKELSASTIELLQDKFTNSDEYWSLPMFIGLTISDDGEIEFDASVIGSGKAYTLTTELKDLADTFLKYGITITGYFVLVGEEPGDIVRYLFEEDNKFKIQKARIVFGD